MRLQHIVDLLTVGVGNLHAAEAALTKAAALQAGLLRRRWHDLTISASARAARSSAATSVARRCAIGAATAAGGSAPGTISAAEAAAIATAAAEALCLELVAHAIGAQAEERAGRNGFTRVLDRVVRNGDHVVTLVDEHRHFAIHARLEQAFLVVEVHENRKHRDVLLHDRLRLDLLDDAAEAAIGICVDGDVGRLTRVHVADVRLVEQRANANGLQVGHLYDGRTAAHGAGRRGDDGSDGDGLVDDRADGGGANGRVLEALLRQVEAGLGADDAGF